MVQLSRVIVFFSLAAVGLAAAVPERRDVSPDAVRPSWPFAFLRVLNDLGNRIRASPLATSRPTPHSMSRPSIAAAPRPQVTPGAELPDRLTRYGFLKHTFTDLSPFIDRRRNGFFKINVGLGFECHIECMLC
jgi:hypothetical protein